MDTITADKRGLSTLIEGATEGLYLLDTNGIEYHVAPAHESETVKGIYGESYTETYENYVLTLGETVLADGCADIVAMEAVELGLYYDEEY